MKPHLINSPGKQFEFLNDREGKSLFYIQNNNYMSNYFDEKISFMEPIVTQYGSRMVMIFEQILFQNLIKMKLKKLFYLIYIDKNDKNNVEQNIWKTKICMQAINPKLFLLYSCNRFFNFCVFLKTFVFNRSKSFTLRAIEYW